MIEIIFNGKKYSIYSDRNFLDCAIDLKLDIPNLCGASDCSDKKECGICLVQADNQLVKACELMPTQGMNIISDSHVISVARKKLLTNIVSDHFADCEAPCKIACPAHVDIQTYLHLIAQNKPQEAVAVIKKTLPMPLSIGRVCPAFCELECRRNLVDGKIPIRKLKRYAADMDHDMSISYVAPKKASNGHKVAVVGAGPAGLTCGYYLTNLGFEVDVFEAMPKAGGWLRYGIPEYRLPKDVLDAEIEHMCTNGMNIKTNQKLGVDFTLDTLSTNYSAVCLATGASIGLGMSYIGSDLKGCHIGVEFLTKIALNEEVFVGKNVAVIGGGNSAIDCARTAKRMGANVSVIYRRSKKDMPAEDFEIEAAEDEGIKIYPMTNPVANIADEKGFVNSIKLEKMVSGPVDSSGRSSPEATGEFFTLEFDTVIYAVSQKVDLSIFDGSNIKLAQNKNGTQISDVETMYSGVANIFSIGDLRRGPATAIEAIGDGLKAALGIEQLVKGKLKKKIPLFNAAKALKLSHVSKEHYAHIPKAKRANAKELPFNSRTNFNEVEIGCTTDEALAEAKLCLDCGCQANTNCLLRDYATEYGAVQDYVQPMTQFKIDYSEFLTIDANKCISCGQCVDVCHVKNGHDVLSLSNNGRVGFGEFSTLSSSNCVQCGSCIQVCPTGAIVDARDYAQSRVKTLTPITTICTYCGVGCSIKYFVDKDENRICYAKGADSIVNDGMLCVKGRFGFDFINSPKRLTSPLIRKNGELEEASWDEAISLIAKKWSAIKDEFGSDSLAGFASAKATNEDNYLFQKFIRQIFGTNNIDHCARLCHASSVTGLEASLGSAAMTNDIESIKDSDVIFVIGSDTTAAHPIIGSYIKRAVKDGARLIIADPKKIALADVATKYVAQNPGTDVMLLNAIMQIIITNSWQDDAYINERCIGYDELKEEVLKPCYSLENASLITGIDGADINDIAAMIGTSKRVAVYYAMGITQHVTGHDNVRSIANLQLLCGNIGVEGGGINPLRGQSNVQGSCDMGGLPNNFPGYQKVFDTNAHTKFTKAWECSLSDKEGLSLTEIIDEAHNGSIKSIYIMGENPILSDPDQAHVEEALKHLDFLVVQDIFLTETANFADVVLPAYSFAEKTGHFTNTERRVQRLNPVVEAPIGARDDWKIIQDLANSLGANWNYKKVAEITNEIASLVPNYAGITWENLSKYKNLQWPCSIENGALGIGTRILHKDKIILGKGIMAATPYLPAAEKIDSEYPLVLTTGRVLEQFHTGTMTRKTEGLNNLATPAVVISVADANKLELDNGEMVKVISRRGDINIKVFITKRIKPGIIFIPFHFAEAPANRLTNVAKDPYAKIPEFKVASVRIEKLC